MDQIFLIDTQAQGQTFVIMNGVYNRQTMGGGDQGDGQDDRQSNQTRKKDNQTFYRGGLKRQTKGARMSHIEHTKLKGKPKQDYV